MKSDVPLGWDNEGSVGAKKVMGVRKSKFSHEEEEEEEEDAVAGVVFRKPICFGSKGVAMDKLVFGMLKHDHVSFQILIRYFYRLDFGTKPLINMLLIVFCSLFIFY